MFENRVDVEAIARHEVNVLYGLGGCRQILGKEIADVAYQRGYSPTEKSLNWHGFICIEAKFNAS